MDTENFWLSVYRDYFPLLFSGHAIGCAADSALRQDIDRLLYAGGDRVIRMKEVLHPPGCWPDAYIETGLTVRGEGKGLGPGWIDRELSPCPDYIAFGWPDQGKAYILDYNSLRWAWRANRNGWKKKQRSRFILQFDGYTVELTRVPVGYLVQAMTKAVAVHLTT